MLDHRWGLDAIMQQILFCTDADKTDDIEDCDNFGCCFNAEGKCTATCTECFGYIQPKDEGVAQ